VLTVDSAAGFNLSSLMLQIKKLLYDLLFRASAETLLQVALDPEDPGAEIGFLSVLHTWGSKLTAPPAHPLRHPSRRTFPRSPPLDSPLAITSSCHATCSAASSAASLSTA
jgi:hypothetical protein